VNPKLPCAPGHFCPAGTAHPSEFACANGTYSPAINLTAQSDCTVCPEGYYCTGGADQPSGPCTSGYYCPSGTAMGNQYPCPAGTHGNGQTNLTQSSDCFDCPVAHFCLIGSSVPIPCYAGTYSNVTNQPSVPCPTCPGGYYCPTETNQPIDCGVGYYSDDGASVCLSCQAGYYCDVNTTSKLFMWNDRICPEGILVNSV